MDKNKFLITPEDVERETVAQGMHRRELEVPPVVIFTFSNAVLEELKIRCRLKDWEWAPGKFGPFYSLEKGWKGSMESHDIGVFFPPMGASPIAALGEDLIHYGARVIFLLCSSWGLGRDHLAQGQIHLPSFACGMDGTSPYYGNKTHKVEAEPRAFGALSHALDVAGADWKKGGVGCCEAFYRITSQMMKDYRGEGCLSMENGEVGALYSIAREKQFPIGILLQPYINLEQGWKMSFMNDKYRETCRVQARVALEAVKELL